MKALLSSLTFLIPAYNDERTVEKVVREADAAGKEVAKHHDLIVINDASRDGTGTVLESLRKTIPVLSVIHHTENGGYGRTIKELYYTGRGDWLFTVPGDGQIPPAEVKKLIPSADPADMILGWRTSRNDSPERLRQSRIYNSLLRNLYGIRLHDINTVRLMRSAMMKKIRLTSESAFVDAELSIRALRQGFRITEIPIDHKAREGSTGGGGKLKTILPTVWEMVKFRLLNN